MLHKGDLMTPPPPNEDFILYGPDGKPLSSEDSEAAKEAAQRLEVLIREECEALREHQPNLSKEKIDRAVRTALHRLSGEQVNKKYVFGSEYNPYSGELWLTIAIGHRKTKVIPLNIFTVLKSAAIAIGTFYAMHQGTTDDSQPIRKDHDAHPTKHGDADPEVSNEVYEGQVAEAMRENRQLTNRWQEEENGAHMVREKILPPDRGPQVSGIDYAVRVNFAPRFSGDFYDFQALPFGRFGLVLGHASGKGISAALIMSNMAVFLRRSIREGKDLAETFLELNEQVFQTSPDGRYANAFCAVYDSGKRELEYVNAGLPPAILLNRRSYAIVELNFGGSSLGIFADPPVHHAIGRIMLNPGDIIIAATEGLTGATDIKGQPWGMERLSRTAVLHSRSSNVTAEQLISGIIKEAEDFRSGVESANDITIVALKVRE